MLVAESMHCISLNCFHLHAVCLCCAYVPRQHKICAINNKTEEKTLSTHWETKLMTLHREFVSNFVINSLPSKYNAFTLLLMSKTCLCTSFILQLHLKYFNKNGEKKHSGSFIKIRKQFNLIIFAIDQLKLAAYKRFHQIVFRFNVSSINSVVKSIRNWN